MFNKLREAEAFDGNQIVREEDTSIGLGIYLMSMFIRGFLAAVVLLIAVLVTVEIVGIETVKSNLCNAFGCREKAD